MKTRIVLFMLTMMLSLSFMSCQKEDPPVEPPMKFSEFIVGTWVSTNIESATEQYFIKLAVNKNTVLGYYNPETNEYSDVENSSYFILNENKIKLFAEFMVWDNSCYDIIDKSSTYNAIWNELDMDNLILENDCVHIKFVRITK